MWNKRILKVCFVSVTLIIVILFLCPIPTCINTYMKGIHISQNGEFVGNIAVNISGWKYDYLFFRDKVKLTFNTDEPVGKLDNKLTYEYKINDSSRRAALFFYNNSLNRFSSGVVIYNTNFSSCLMEMEGELFGADSQDRCYFVLSSEQSVNLWDILNEYRRQGMV